MGDNVLTGLLPGGSSSVLLFSSHHYDGKWTEVEGITTHLLDHIQPCWPSEEKRGAVIKYVERLIKQHFDCQVYTFGSVPLKTYLPNGDIDITVFSLIQQLNKRWATDLQGILKREEQNRQAKFRVKEVQCIYAEVQIVKCLVDDIIVDISFNQLGGLCTLCFLEEVDQMIGRNHLFKRSIILIKAWCFYESRILGAHHGLISTYALETLVLYIFHIFHASLHGPLEVLYKFLAFFSQFDWEQYCLSLWGPIRLSALEDMAEEPPERPGSAMLLSHEFLHKCSQVNAVFSVGQDIPRKMFITKHMNVMDPLRIHNNLGRSVSIGNLSRIRSAFALGARKLEKLLSGPHDELTGNLNDFFFNTRNYCTINRLDALTLQVVSHATKNDPSCEDQGESQKSFRSERESIEAAKSSINVRIDIQRDNDSAVDLASNRDRPCACKFQCEKTCCQCLPSPSDSRDLPLCENYFSNKSSKAHYESNLVTRDSKGWCKGLNCADRHEFGPSGNNQSTNLELCDCAWGVGSDECTEDEGESQKTKEDYEAASKDKRHRPCEGNLTCTVEDEKGFIANGTCSLSTDSLSMHSPSDEALPAIPDILTDNTASVLDQRNAVDASNSLDGGAQVSDSKDSHVRLDEATSDILRGDIATHLSNLHVGRWILSSQYHDPWIFPPPLMFPSNQEPFFWDGTGRPFGNMNTSIHGFLPSEQFPVSQIKGLGSPQVAIQLHAQMLQSQFHRGTGTYLPNLHPSGVYKERHAMGHNRNYRGGKAVHCNDMLSQVGDNPLLSGCHGAAHGTRNEGRMHANKVIPRSEKSYYERKAAQKWPEVSQEDRLPTSFTNGDMNLRLTSAMQSSKTSSDSSGRKELHFYSIDKPNPSSTNSRVLANDKSLESSKSGLLSLPTLTKLHQSSYQDGLSTQWGRSIRDHENLRCGEHVKLRDRIVPVKCKYNSSMGNSYEHKDEDFPPLSFCNQPRSLDACDVEKSPVAKQPHYRECVADSLI